MAAQQEQQTPSQIEEPTAQPSTPEEEKLIKEFPSEKKAATGRIVLVVLGILVAGVATGFLLSRGQGKVGELKSTERIAEEGLREGDVFGNPDKETFRDEVEGVLVKGGIDGEGSHRLLRPGGESQNVYLTSSVVDLDQFVDHEILVWGETFAAQKAGWLMDVGRVEVLKLNAEKPFEE